MLSSGLGWLYPLLATTTAHEQLLAIRVQASVLNKGMPSVPHASSATLRRCQQPMLWTSVTVWDH